MKKLLALLLVVVMVVSCMAACKPADNNTTNPSDNKVGVNGIAPDTYTYNTYTTSLGTNWNPHTWEMSGDSTIMSYIETPLADITVKDSTTGEYQWIFVAATDIKDVTADHQDDLTKYNVVLPEGKTAADITEDYVFEISLREGMVWEDGTVINADTYIYSMQQLLDPKLQNYRANNYYSGESALAGANAYFNQGKPIFAAVVPAYGETDTPDYSFDITANKVYINLTAATTFSSSYTFEWMVKNGYIKSETYSAVGTPNGDGYVEVTAENKDAVLALMDGFCAPFGLSIYNEDGSVNEAFYKEFLFYDTGDTVEAVDFDKVGLYKVDDYTIRYVCEVAYDYYYFLTSCTSNWIVHKDLYESCKEYNDDGSYKGTKYGTTKDTTMSYGAYKMASLEDAKQLVFVQNEKYWEYKTGDDGNLYSETFFEVDGAKQPQYLTQKVIINVMEQDQAKLAFLAGELDDWTVEADDAVKYSTSEQLYKVDETYTMRLFFNTGLAALQAMDKEGNVNSVVLSNYNFRKAMSLALDRSEFVGATAGYKAAYSMLSPLYFYDVYEDPASIYRNTEEAMKAICNVYGVAYGEGTPYATLEDAYKSINGYNKTEATELFKKALAELVEAGLYTAGADIKIQVGWAKGAMSAADNQQVTLLNKYLNDAMAGTGFGKIELVAVDNITNRYADVASGVYAIGWGAWGGAAFYPFTMFQVYCDPDYADLHEAGCWDPTVETLTLTVDGVEDTMTWQAWSSCMAGTGKYANASNEVKLQILADLEENFLEKYYCIPVCTTTVCSMLSYKTSNYTDNYSIMYGFGGMRLMTYNYTNAEWAKFVADNNGEIGY